MFNIYKIQPLNGELKELTFKEFTFPAGEVSVKLNANDYAFRELNLPATIVARIQNSDDLFKLAMIKDALARLINQPINLFLPYVPYARQDRVCDKGESFSVAILARFVASLGFDKVTIVDPHSDATPAAFEALGVNLTVIKQLDIVNSWLEFTGEAMGSLLVSPDAGSNKKTSDAATYLNHSEFVRADKLRDLTTGAIKEIIVYADDLKGRDVIILDDICERGGTFIGLAKILKQKNAGKISLYVTHGVFGGKSERSDTIGKLLANGIDAIWTTNSFYNDLDTTETGQLKVVDLIERFAHKI